MALETPASTACDRSTMLGEIIDESARHELLFGIFLSGHENGRFASFSPELAYDFK